MPSLLYGHDQAIAQWVAERVPDATGWGPCAAIGVVTDAGRLIAGVVYHEYQPQHETVQLSIAADSSIWARPGIIAGLLAYPFRQLKVWKAWTAAGHDNDRSIRMTRHVGFKQEGVLKDQFGRGRHAVMFRMFRPYYEARYGGIA